MDCLPTEKKPPAASFEGYGMAKCWNCGAAIDVPRKKPERHKILHRHIAPSQYATIERTQDRVCREITGSVPSGGCRYPNCDCRG